MSPRVRRGLRYGLAAALLSGFRWYRRLAGGHWERWWIDVPVTSDVWLPQETCGVRPPLGRGRPTCEHYGPIPFQIVRAHKPSHRPETP